MLPPPDQPADWASWAATRPPLSPRARRLLTRALGPLHPARPVPLAAVSPPPSALPGPARRALQRAVGETQVRLDDRSRLLRAGGQAYLDLVRRRRGDIPTPDAVVAPGSHDEVLAVLRACAEHGVAVVPYGGGTSVVGGVEALRGPFPAVVVLDLARLDRLRAVDAMSLLAVAEPGLRGPAAEAGLARHGLTLGHFPQSFERATLGGFAVTRSAGQASTGYGRFDELVAGLRLATPTGGLVLPAQPASAAGPDLRRLVLGSEGTLGVVTELSLRVHRAPAVRRYEGWMLPSWSSGLQVVRRLGQAPARPDIARLSDPEETRVAFALTGPSGAARAGLAAYLRLRRRADGCLLVLGFEGEPADVRHRRRLAAAAARTAGGISLGAAAGRAWEHGRFAAPALRDTLLDAGVLVETLETAATWSRLPELHAAVTAALRGQLGRVLVGTHVSHLYATGASLYFTVLAAQDPADPVGQWQAAKRAASEAIVAAGDTITHHHAVGTAHAPWLVAETGELGVAALRAVKRELDPTGILNPGKLLPPG